MRCREFGRRMFMGRCLWAYVYGHLPAGRIFTGQAFTARDLSRYVRR